MPQIHRVPAFTDNYIWLIEYEARKAAVVDPGDAAPVLKAAEEKSLTITHILNTHWHPDHVGGNLEIKAATGATIIGPKEATNPIPGLDTQVGEGDTVRVGDHEAEVLFVGAHTAGHIAYHFESLHALFPGDTLFAMGCGRLFEGTPEDMFKALGKLGQLPPETQVYCAHEYTLSNAEFAITVEPDNKALQQRYAATKAARAKDQPTVPFLLQDDLATNPFLRAPTPKKLGEIRLAKDNFK